MAHVWRRVVLLKYKADACRGAIARAQSIHHSFARTMPAVLHASEGFTFTSGRDGGGAYPGEHDVNRGFDSAVEMVVDVDNAADMASKFWDHPAHAAAGDAIGPLIEAAARMDWLEPKDAALAAVPAPTQPFVKHVVFFELDGGATAGQKEALFDGWRGLVGQVPGLLGVSCGAPLAWPHGADPQKYGAGICADIALESVDGVAELNAYHTHPAFQAVSKELLAPIRKGFVVMDAAYHPSALPAD